MARSQHAQAQFIDIARLHKAGQLEPVQGFPGLKVYEFSLIGAYSWAVAGHADNRRTIWVWSRPCRWCGATFYQTTAAVELHPDCLRMVNCEHHRNKPRPDAVINAGRLTAAATARQNRRQAARERIARLADDPTNHAAAFDAVRAILANGGRLCMGRSSPDYVGKRIRRIGTLTKRQIPGVIAYLIASGSLEVGRVGTDGIGRPVNGLMIPKAPD
jgi:hypothetical protein